MQIAMPRRRRRPQARAFFVDVLGMTEVPQARGHGPARRGVVPPPEGSSCTWAPRTTFVPDRKGTRASSSTTSTTWRRLTRSEWPLRWDDDFPGFRRFYANDPFGNRMEFLQER